MVFLRGKNGDKAPLVVDTSLKEWSNLHPDNIKDFVIDYGILHACKEQYPGGILPGMTKKDEDLQTAKIKRFDNLVEWTKLLEEDVMERDGKYFLRSKYFDRREKAWKCPFFLKREGKIYGYYIDSVFLHPSDNTWMEAIVFLRAYKDIISNHGNYKRILEHLRQGGSVELKCKNIDYALTETFSLEKILELILLEDLSNQNTSL